MSHVYIFVTFVFRRICVINLNIQFHPHPSLLVMFGRQYGWRWPPWCSNALPLNRPYDACVMSVQARGQLHLKSMLTNTRSDVIKMAYFSMMQTPEGQYVPAYVGLILWARPSPNYTLDPRFEFMYAHMRARTVQQNCEINVTAKQMKNHALHWPNPSLTFLLICHCES